MHAVTNIHLYIENTTRNIAIEREREEQAEEKTAKL